MPLLHFSESYRNKNAHVAQVLGCRSLSTAVRYMGFNGQAAALRSWRSAAETPRESRLENGFSDPAVTPDEPKSEPLPDTPSLLPADSNGLSKSILQRQQSLVILTGRTHAMASHSQSHTVIDCYSFVLTRGGK